MKNKTYLKATFREITKSKGRFIAIILIIFLGTLLYVGIKTTQPVLDHSADVYLKERKLSDLQVVSTGGITNADKDVLDDITGLSIESGYQFFYADAKKNEVIQVFSYDQENNQNHLELTSGALPKKDNEILLDHLAKKEGYKIGDTYTINDHEQLKSTQFKIVGFVTSPLFISEVERGYANVGNGSVSYFAYLPKKLFKAEVESVMYLSFANVKKYETYSNAYKEQMAKNTALIEDKLSQRPNARLKEIQADAAEKLRLQKEKIATGKKELENAQEQLQQAKDKLALQAAQINLLPEPQKTVAQQELTTAQKQLATNEATLKKNQSELATGTVEIKKTEATIKNMKEIVYRYNDRFDNVGFQEFGSLSDRIAAIADVFPVFFFFIAALITFTTMTRMVEENRREIGTLKALGYTKAEIAKKYVIYSLLAASIGLVLGVVSGTNFLPRIIFYLMSDRYSFNKAYVFYDWDPILKAIIAFLLATLGSALIVLTKELREKPAQLLQPKAPKPGKRIFLEYITPLWSRLSFNQKVSYRNLFRYKARMLMAIIGIAGCTGLMLAGFGLKDSLSSVAAKQFGPIIDYQGIVSLEDDLPAADTTAITNALKSDEQVTSFMASHNETVEIRKNNQATQSLTLMVPTAAKEFEDYLHLHNKDNKVISLTNTGAVITKKMAEFYDIKKGDTLYIYDSKQQKQQIKIAGIAQNYLGSFLYMTRPYYEKVTNQKFSANSLLLKTNKMTTKEEDNLAQVLLDTKKVVNTTFISKQIETQNQSISNLNAIVWILVTLSGLLAFVVLYNLTNINISERVRELSTIKVLGFFDKEVTMYIVRENIIFTILGIIAGFGVGRVLTHFILNKASMENMVFPLVIKPAAYLYSGGLTIIFTLIVMLVTHFKLKHINMIDALKSNE